MALINLGPIIGGIKGSIGATTFAKTRYGYIAKQKAQPVNPDKPKQTEQRGFMTEAVAAWKHTLTPAEILTWIHGAQLHKRSHIGQGYELSGINLFVGYYCLMRKCAQVPATECTVFEGAPPNVLPEVTTEGVTGKQEISTNPVPDANTKMLVYASDGVSPGINYKSVPFVFWTQFSFGGPPPVLIDVVYPASGLDYNLFWGTRYVDVRGAISGLLTSRVSGTMA